MDRNFPISGPKLILLLLAFLILPCGVVAEDILKHGVRFPVDEVTEVDAESVRVTLFGESRVVAPDAVEEYVLQQYFSSTGVGDLTRSQVFSFIQGSLQDRDIPSAALAFRALLQYPGISELEILEFVDGMPESEFHILLYKELLRNALELKEMPDVLGSMAYEVARIDARWLKTEGVRNVYLYGDAVKRCFNRRFYQDLVEVKIDEITASLDALSELFGSEDPLYRELNLIAVKLNQGISAVERLDPEGMFALLDLAQSNETLKKVLPPVIVQTVHRTAQQALVNGNAGKALTLLSWIEFDWRTPTTHALVTEALGKLEPDQSSNIFGTRIEKFLAFLSSKDPLVQNAYAQFLDQDLRRKINAGHFGQVSPYFERLTLVRPDPDRQNDALRVFGVIQLFDAGYPAAAHDLYELIQTRISPLQWFELFRRGIIVDLTIFACGVLIPILLLLWLVLRRFPAPGKEEDPDLDPLIDEEFLDSDTSLDDEQPVFASFVGKSRDPVYLSYEKQLRKFNLTPDALLREIKHAYRQAIKEVHPDINPNVDDKGRERFLELTNSYERILRLRERLGYPSD